MKKRLIMALTAITTIFSLSSCRLFSLGNDNDYNSTNPDAEIVEITSSYTDVKNKVYYGCFGVKTTVSSSKFSVGSAVCIKKEGKYSYFLTNRHVVEANDKKETSNKVYIYFGDGYLSKGEVLFSTTYDARIANEANDLAVIKLETPTDYRVDPVTISSDVITKGVDCVSIGCPINLTNYNTITAGNVSKMISNENLIMHTATINPGNSGGGLFNLKGELIGLNVSRTETTDSGAMVVDMYYAISASKIKSFLTKNDFEL